MDALSDVLETIELSGVIFLRADLSGQYGLRIPPPTIFHPTVRPSSTEHKLVMFHIIREGSGYVEMEGSDPQLLAAGDLIMVFDDVDHCVVDSPGRPALDSRHLPPYRSNTLAPPALQVGDGDISMRVVCGMLQFIDSGYNPLFSSLPPLLIIRKSDGPSSEWLQGNITHIIREAESERPGTMTLLSRMTELLFVETLRAYLRKLPEEEIGWLSALRDPIVGRALELLHESPSERWTVARLAKDAGASRSALSARFTQLLGIAPMAYLTRWRMRRAQKLLASSTSPLAQISGEVGYESESAFHRAFRKEVGQAPAAWRQLHARSNSRVGAG